MIERIDSHVGMSGKGTADGSAANTEVSSAVTPETAGNRAAADKVLINWRRLSFSISYSISIRTVAHSNGFNEIFKGAISLNL